MTWEDVKQWVVDRKRALIAKAPWITMGRFLAIFYVGAILCVTFVAVPDQRDRSFVLAARYLGPNTRMARTLWIEPRGQSLSDRIERDRLEEELLGKYVRRPIEGGAPIARADVMPWPDVPNEDVVPVLLDGEPDWMMLNQGSTVEVWIGPKAATPHYALVQAIVTSDTKWIALLRRSDFAPDMLGNPGDKPTLRLVRFPHKPPPPPPPKP
jgi:hypothetical protein